MTKVVSAAIAFDYLTLPPDVATDAKDVAHRVRNIIAGQRESVIETGRLLMRVKEQLEHGQFGQWIEAEIGISARSAQHYMNAFSVYGSKNEIVSLLPQSTLYKLAAPSTPESVRKVVEEHLTAMKAVDADEINDIIKSGKEAHRKQAEKVKEAERRAKLSPEQRRAEDQARKRKETAAERARREEQEARQQIEQSALRRKGAADAAVALLLERVALDDLRTLHSLLNEAGIEFMMRLSNEVNGRSPTTTG